MIIRTLNNYWEEMINNLRYTDLRGVSAISIRYPRRVASDNV